MANTSSKDIQEVHLTIPALRRKDLERTDTWSSHSRTPSTSSTAPSTTHDEAPSQTHPSSKAAYGHHPLHDPSQRHIHVLVAGAGPSGLSVAMELKTLPHVSFHVFEKNDDVGGTWYENRYPGAACDVASHAYQWSMHGNPGWSHHFSPAEEIGAYIKDIATKTSLYEHVSLNSKIVDARWDEEACKWVIQIEDQSSHAVRREECDIFVNAGGILNDWKWPDIPGLDAFQGKLVHSAAWDPTVKLEGQRIGVIGSGATSIQIVPAIQPLAKSLKVFVRSPTYIIPTVGFGVESSTYNESYTGEQKKHLSQHPDVYLAFRKRIEQQMNENFAASVRGSPEQQLGRQWAERVMREALALSPELQAKLIPSWELGCRRLTPGKPYLEAVQRANVHIERTGIEKVCERGIVTVDGNIHELDVLICATGFNASFSGRYQITGKAGRTLGDLWTDTGPEAYFGLAVSGLPNYFTLLGPNCPIANGSLFPCIEATARYIRRVIEKVQRCQIRTLDVKPAVQRQLNDYLQRVHQDLVWTGSCNSWCKLSLGMANLLLILCRQRSQDW